jgi:hypothetical protein
MGQELRLNTISRPDLRLIVARKEFEKELSLAVLADKIAQLSLLVNRYRIRISEQF